MTNGIFLTIRTRHIPKVISDPYLWDDCAAQWGTGFLVAMSSRVREWCESHSEVHAAVEKRIQQAWKDYFLASLAKLCNSEDLLSEQKPSE